MSDSVEMSELLPNQYSLHTLQRRLHSTQFSCLNHLLSIQLDADSLVVLIDYVSNHVYQLPVICNLRNGAWYYRSPSGYSYFKSTDGHDGTWNFNLTRINLNIALMIAKNNGGIIIDSTRRGKVFPDSLRTTVPVWIAVLNNIVLHDNKVELPVFMHESMQQDIHSKLDAIIDSIPAKIKEIIINTLRDTFTRPMQPIWVNISNDGSIEWHGNYAEEYLGYTGDGATLPFLPVLLYSASRLTCSEAEHSEHHSWHYIQGAGDDEEHWCPKGFDANIFWRFKDEILASTDTVLVEKAIQDIVSGCECSETSNYSLVPLGNTGIVLSSNYLTMATSIDLLQFDACIVVQPFHGTCETISHAFHPNTLLINTIITTSKCESMQVENERWLQDIIPSLFKLINTLQHTNYRIYITSGCVTKAIAKPTSNELLPCVLVAVVIVLMQQDPRHEITKTTLKSVLLEIQTYLPHGLSVSIPRRYHKILHNYFIVHE